MSSTKHTSMLYKMCCWIPGVVNSTDYSDFVYSRCYCLELFIHSCIFLLKIFLGFSNFLQRNEEKKSRHEDVRGKHASHYLRIRSLAMAFVSVKCHPQNKGIAKERTQYSMSLVRLSYLYIKLTV